MCTQANLIQYAPYLSKQANAELLFDHQTIVFSLALTNNKSILHYTPNIKHYQNLKQLNKKISIPTAKIFPQLYKVIYNLIYLNY